MAASLSCSAEAARCLGNSGFLGSIPCSEAQILLQGTFCGKKSALNGVDVLCSTGSHLRITAPIFLMKSPEIFVLLSPPSLPIRVQLTLKFK